LLFEELDRCLAKTRGENNPAAKRAGAGNG
jgi:hypothetical protein